MNTTTLLDAFDLLAEAPGGVARLRALILQLAVQGRLVEQDPSDEPASVLLERVGSERERWIRLGKAKRIEPLSPLQANQGLFSLKRGWIWTYLDNLTTSIHYGYTASSNPSIRDVRLLRITDIQNNKVDWDSVPGCEIDQDTIKSYELNDGDILIARTGGTIGKSYIVENLSVRAIFASYLIRIVPIKPINPRYLKLFMETPLYWEQLYAKAMGTGQPNVNGTSLKSLKVPLPPLAEQRRIVERVEQLTALCDDLEAKQARRRAERQRLGEALTGSLLAAREPADAAAAWARLRDAFDALYETPESVGPLRQAILQLAVQGRLVEQDPNDEPASVLLKRIRMEKLQIMQEGKPNKVEYIPSLSNPVSNIDLPNRWELVRLDDLLLFLRNGIAEAPTGSNGTPILRISALRPNIVNTSDIRYLQNSIENYTDYILHENDLLFTRYSGNRDYVGICGVFPKTHTQIVHPDKLIRGKLIDNLVTPQYISFAANTGVSRAYIQQFLKTTAGQVGVAGKDLKLMPIPLPPLAEQRRIVERVEQLMALCDELEAKLREERAAAERAADALCRALGGGSLPNAERRRPSADEPERRGRGRPPGAERQSPPARPAARPAPAPQPRQERMLLAEPEDSPPASNGAAHTAPAGNGAAHGGQATLVQEALALADDAAGGDYALLRALLLARGALTNSEVQDALGLDPASARALLRQLVEEGLARVEGQRRGTRYVRV